MGCVVNAIKWSKISWCCTAFGKVVDLLMKKRRNYAKLSGDALINKFIEEVEFEAEKENNI